MRRVITRLLLGLCFVSLLAGAQITGSGRIFGTAGNDLITGSAGADRIYGGQGADLIDGKAGNDFIDVGRGNDLLDEQPQVPLIGANNAGVGGPGSDEIHVGDLDYARPGVNGRVQQADGSLPTREGTVAASNDGPDFIFVHAGDLRNGYQGTLVINGMRSDDRIHLPEADLRFGKNGGLVIGGLQWEAKDTDGDGRRVLISFTATFDAGKKAGGKMQVFLDWADPAMAFPLAASRAAVILALTRLFI